MGARTSDSANGGANTTDGHSPATGQGQGHKDEVPWLHRNSSLREPDPDNGITDETLAEWRKMVSGQVYMPGDPYIMTQRRKVGEIIEEVNRPELRWDIETTTRLLKGLIGAGENTELFYLMPPIFMQFGNLNIENDVLISPEAHILDVCPIHIGTRTMIGARATIVSGGHHPIPELRWNDGGGKLMASADGAPIYIGRDCWIGKSRSHDAHPGANTTITQGVRIGDGTVIGAGSVVNKDVPNRCVAAGNPVRIIRWLEEGESLDEYIKRFENGDNGGHMGRMAPGPPPPPSRVKDAERWKKGEGRVWLTNYGRS